MTKVKKLLKKAFTLVELVVVVAIIAILSGVSVAAYVGITDRANKAADQDVVAQLNLQLAAQEAIEGKNKTCFDAIADCYSTGLNLEELTPSTKNSQYVWDQDNDRFAILNDDLEVIAEDSTFELTSNQNHRWVLANTYQVNAKKNPIYLLDGCLLEDLAVTTGVDTGINKNIKTITFTAPAEAPEGDIVIRTNLVDMTLTVDASDAKLASTNIQHYGICGIVESVKTTTNKYIENGTVSMMTLDEGKAEFTKGSKVYNLMHTKDKNPQIEVNSMAHLYEYNGTESRWFEESFNSDTANKYTNDATLKEGCDHQFFDTAIDSRGVYELCCGCGLPIINKVNNILGYIDRFAVSTSLYGDPYLRPVFMEYSTIKVTSSTAGMYKILAYPEINYQMTTEMETPELAEEQRYCAHKSFSYLHDSNESDNYHICKCNDCGYQFKEAHSTGNQCSICGELLHEWDENHNCKIHGEAETKKYTYTSDTLSIDLSICGKSIAIWGLNDADKAFLSTSVSIRTVLVNALSLSGNNVAERITGTTIQLMNATYVPKNFFDMDWAAKYAINNIILPESLEAIGAQAFRYTSGITSLTIPNGVTSIGGDAFFFCGARKLVWPSSCKTISNGVMENIVALTELVLPEGVATIEQTSLPYREESNLKTLTLPSTITKLSRYMFRVWTIKELKFNGTVAQWNNINFNDAYGENRQRTFESAPAGFKVQCLDGDVSVSSK